MSSNRQGSAGTFALRDMVTSDERRAVYEQLGHWDGSTLAARVAAHAAAQDRLAVIDLAGRREVTYAELDSDANRVASFLRSVGVERGDVVSVQLPNWYETVVVDLGVLKAGAVLNPMITLYRRRELRHMLTVGRSKVLFTPREYRSTDHEALVAELRAELPDLAHHVVVADPGGGGVGFRSWLDRHSPAAEVADPTPASAVSELIFTSGTEAQPKAVMHTEQTANFSVRSVWSSLGMSADDIVWTPSPIGHSTGLNFGVRFALYNGVTLVLQDRWSAEEAAALIARYRCTYGLAATTFVRDLVEWGATSDCDLSSLKCFGSGGSPVPASLVSAAADIGVNLLRLYGATEFLCLTWNRPGAPEAKRLLTDGDALDGQEIDVRDDEGRSVRNEQGEIFARTAGTSVGFFGDPERTAQTFAPDGWISSGDLGVLDDDGYLTVVGRKKEIIIRGGLNIAPREIEDMIHELPQVLAVAVVGLPDERLGEVTCACVVPRQGTTLALSEIVDALRQQGLATFKLPQALVVLDALPTTASGKIQKHALLETIAGSPALIERV